MDRPLQGKWFVMILCGLALLPALGCTKRVRTTQQGEETPIAESKPAPEVTSPVQQIPTPPPVQEQSQAPTPSKPTEQAPVLLTLDDLYFDFDRAVIRPELKRILDQNVRWLEAHPSSRIAIEGHCDERGTEEYNLALGDRRARVAARYLEASGIAPSRIRTISYGVERPFCSDHNEACWQQNRRDHFIEVKGTASAK